MSTQPNGRIRDVVRLLIVDFNGVGSIGAIGPERHRTRNELRGLQSAIVLDDVLDRPQLQVAAPSDEALTTVVSAQHLQIFSR